MTIEQAKSLQSQSGTNYNYIFALQFKLQVSLFSSSLDSIRIDSNFEGLRSYKMLTGMKYGAAQRRIMFLKKKKLKANNLLIKYWESRYTRIISTSHQYFNLNSLITGNYVSFKEITITLNDNGRPHVK